MPIVAPERSYRKLFSGNVAEVKHKEGRHVGLDIYDLLIEAVKGAPFFGAAKHDPEHSSQVHAKFQGLYDEIEKARDEYRAFDTLLQFLSKPRKPWN